MLSKKIMESIPHSIRTLRLLSVETLEGDLTLQQLRVLKLVHEGHGPTQISKILQVSMAAVSKMVDSLVTKGLLVRKSGKDKRSIDLVLTPKGKKMWGQVTKGLEGKLNDAIKKLTADERNELLKGLVILDKVTDLLQKV